MSFVKKAAAGTVFGGSLLFTAGLGMANAQPVEAPDGLVNVEIGDVTILDGVPAEKAANTASAICGSSPAEVGALAQQVDSDGAVQTVCAGLPGGDLVLTQNVSAETTEAPAEETAPAEESAPADDAGSAEEGAGAGAGDAGQYGADASE